MSDSSMVISIEEERKRELACIREHRQYLAQLDGMRKGYSRALPAEYVYEKILLKRAKGEKGISSGIDWWDRFAGPFRRSNLYVIAGYQGVGKTTLANTIGWNIAKRGYKVWDYCVELTADESFEVVGGVILGKSELTPDDEALVYAQVQETGFRFYEPELDMRYDQHIDLICDTVHKDAIDLVIIDNFSFITSVSKNSYETERVAAKRLKSLAQELEIPIIVLAHLRKPERDDSEPEPTAHTVLGSGAISQVSSDTFILHHPLVNEEEQSRHPVGYLLSGKPRWRSGGKRYVRFSGATRSYTTAFRDEYEDKKKRRGGGPGY